MSTPRTRFIRAAAALLSGLAAALALLGGLALSRVPVWKPQRPVNVIEQVSDHLCLRTAVVGGFESSSDRTIRA